MQSTSKQTFLRILTLQNQNAADSAVVGKENAMSSVIGGHAIISQRLCNSNSMRQISNYSKIDQSYLPVRVRVTLNGWALLSLTL